MLSNWNAIDGTVIGNFELLHFQVKYPPVLSPPPPTTPEEKKKKTFLLFDPNYTKSPESLTVDNEHWKQY